MCRRVDGCSTTTSTLLLNLAIGGSWPGNATDDPSLPVTMLVDWVRVHGAKPSTER
jgi:hypothetical protein